MDHEKTGLTKEIYDALQKRGIDLVLSGCGCCSGIYAQVYIDGNLVIDVEESFDIDTLPEEETT